MSFRKRNVALGRAPPGDLPAAEATSAPAAASPTSQSSAAPPPSPASSYAAAAPPHHAPGTRPSPLDGRIITSTGIPDLDAQLGGHGGLVLGNSLVIAENGTTDFAGAMARCYAAEGVAQGQIVHVIGVHEQWGADIPGIVEEKPGKKRPPEVKARTKAEEDRMRIAWRYERLGQFDRARESQITPDSKPFPHTFDLRTRMPPSPNLHIHPLPPKPNPYLDLLRLLRSSLARHPHTPHRILVPQLLSPQTYPPALAHPARLLPFLHGLRALLRHHPATALLTLPLALFPHAAALTRWIQHLSDAVVELVPFGPDELALQQRPAPPRPDNDEGRDREVQGLVRVWKVPVLSERGQGCGGAGGSGTEDLAFSVSRRRVRIVPFYLPPVEGEESAEQKVASEEGQPRVDAKALEF